MSHVLAEDGEKPHPGPSLPSLSELYRDNVDYVWRALVHLGIREADVEDVAHDVFLTVRRRLPSFEGRSSLRTWIYGICLRTASDYRARAFRKRELLQEELPEQSTAPLQEQSSESKQMLGELARLLDTLSAEQREAFVLFEIEELPMKDVAQAMQCPLQTAYSRLHAARAALRSALQEKGYRP